MTATRVSTLTTAQVQRVAKERLIGTAQLVEALGITKQAIVQRVDRGTFPAPIASFGGSFVWDMDQVRTYFPK